jgi:hypothetical protein
MKELIQKYPRYFIKQKKEWLEIFTNWESKNKYVVMSPDEKELAYIIEKDEGFMAMLKRVFLRSHRPLDISVIDFNGQQLLQLTRPFFWFFSDLFINQSGQKMGSVHRRFGILYKKYDLYDSNRQLFATIKCPIWRLWTFKVQDKMGKEICIISKKWQGFLKEAFSDADAFMVDFGHHHASIPVDQKIILFATALSIDFDFFENNQGAGSVLDLFDN